MTKIVICSYGAGNTKSISNMLRRINRQAVITNDPLQITNPDVIVIPGVGSFDFATQRLRMTGWDKLIKSSIADGAKVLGICLGMQVLCDSSDEGVTKGLSLIPGHFRKFKSDQINVPHMGWNSVQSKDSDYTPLLNLGYNNQRFYFVHSYYYTHSDHKFVRGYTEYGHPFPSMISSPEGNIVGVQFHPEKSHVYGAIFLDSIFNSFFAT